MTTERRGQPRTVTEGQPEGTNSLEQNIGRTYAISQEEVRLAWQQVRAKGGTGGIDGEIIKSFEKRLEKNLYKLWNRMSSGSYHPQAVLRVEIPKGDGSSRPLGIPTILDRVAQAVVRARLEPVAERLFHRDPYGYRPGKSALDAVKTCRERCWKYNRVLDVDIQKFFDTINHELLMKVVEKHCSDKWMLLYLRRWLTSPVQHKDGRRETSVKGTPQGGFISPLLVNLYLHYAFDQWMGRSFPEVPFERYADDLIIHCQSEEQSTEIGSALAARLMDCGLHLHPEKTKVVYCKDSKRTGSYPTKKFTFVGYTFQPRGAQNRKSSQRVTGFLPAVSHEAGKKFRTNLKRSRIFSRSTSAWKIWLRRSILRSTGGMVTSPTSTRVRYVPSVVGWIFG